MKKRTFEEFVDLAKIKHGDEFDYSLVVYVNAHVHIAIVCKKHGSFMQTPNQHLKGNKCPKCAGKNKTKEEFISDCKIKHGNKYDYSLVVLDGDSKVSIICPKHGVFNQRAANHKRGVGCPACGGTGKLTTKSFVLKANSIHKFKYDYSETEYINNKSKVTIICQEHGAFRQSPEVHLAGGGCAECKARKATTPFYDFLGKAVLEHKTKYVYNKVLYTNMAGFVGITCPTHGLFWQIGSDHIRGRGCSGCAPCSYNPDEQGYFYVLNCDTFVGFGITNNIDRRLSTHSLTLRKANTTYNLYRTFSGLGADIRNMETSVKRIFKQDRVLTEIEGFVSESISKDKLEALCSYCEQYLDNVGKT